MCNNRPTHFTIEGGPAMFGTCSADSGYNQGDRRSVEPTAQNAFIGMITAATVANNAPIPLTTIFNASGNHITGVNPIMLRAGHKYLVEFTVIGIAAAVTNAFGAQLQLNGVNVAGSAAAISSTAVASNVSGGAIVTVTNTTGTALTLVSISNTTATYSYASVRIVEVE